MKKFFNHDQSNDELPLSLSFPAPANNTKPVMTSSARYTECLKNHAAAIGGHALDGCGEFTPSGPDALTCGACNCHRNFHRKEEGEEEVGPTGEQKKQQQLVNSSNSEPVLFRFYPYDKTASFGGDREKSKRYRTKFTAEQKAAMVELAERVGWRLKKQDEAVVERFCRETGVSRRVFKVWMHNNKHILAKKLLP